MIIVKSIFLIIIIAAMGGLMVGDIYTNTGCLSQLMPFWVSVCISFGVSFSLALFSLHKNKEGWKRWAFAGLITSSSLLSITFMFMRKNISNDAVFVEDALLVKYEHELNKYEGDQFYFYTTRYDSLLGIGLTNGAMASRKHAKTFDVPINSLRYKISRREALLQANGNELNAGFISIFGFLGADDNKLLSQWFLFISYSILGLICPVSMAVLGLSYMIVLPEYSLDSFNFLPFPRFGVNLGEGLDLLGFDKVDDTGKTQVKFLLGVMVVKQVKRENGRLSLSKIGVEAGKRLNRGSAYSTSFVHRCIKGEYDNMLTENSKLLKKFEVGRW